MGQNQSREGVAAPAAPYSADTRAKGWRFELDLERVMQSDTWALASPEVRPWLLMLWAVAWQQVPCGSMPSDDALIAARLGMKLAVFQKTKDVLMRGWHLAEDGRLYHATLTERVLDMLGRKEGERKRKAEYRARMEAERKVVELEIDLKMSRGTDVGGTWESAARDATGTGTGTGTGTSLLNTAGITHTTRELARATPAELSAVLRRHSIKSSSDDPRVIAAAKAGVTVKTVEAACAYAETKKPAGRIPPLYVLTIAESWTQEAVETARARASPSRSSKPAQPHWRDANAATIAAMTGQNRDDDQFDEQIIII